MKKTVLFGLLVIGLVFGFIGCDEGNNDPPPYTGYKSITIKGLDEDFNGKFGEVYVLLDENLSSRIAVTKRDGLDENSKLTTLISSGEFSVDMFEYSSGDNISELSTRWSGDGDYYIFVLIAIGRPIYAPLLYEGFTSVDKIKILKQENTIINFGDYNWNKR